jgi:hypothetical protein
MMSESQTRPSDTARPDKWEYRVRWRREGLRAASQIYQTEDGAREKVERLERLDEVKHTYADDDSYSSTNFANMPDLLTTPTIERRRVDVWEVQS